jgi:hypothetical protein
MQMAAVWLHVMLMMQTRPLLCKWRQRFFCCFFSNLAPVSFSFSSSCLFCVFSSCLEYKLLPETFSRSCNLLHSEQQHQEPVVWTYDNYLTHMFHTITRDAPMGFLRLVTVVGTNVTADYGRLNKLSGITRVWAGRWVSHILCDKRAGRKWPMMLVR